MCYQMFTPGTVTEVISKQNVEVDGMSRHVRNMRCWENSRRFGKVGDSSSVQYRSEESLEIAFPDQPVKEEPLGCLRTLKVAVEPPQASEEQGIRRSQRKKAKASEVSSLSQRREE